MRARTLTAGASALLVLTVSIVDAKNVHSHLEVLHKKHHAHRDLFTSAAETGENGVELRSLAPDTLLERRSGQCQFPANVGLVAVTPNAQNAGWAQSPDQPCLPGNYCPYACPAGQVSMQWDPSATSYTYPKSMVKPPTLYLPGDHWLISVRMAVSIAIITAPSANRSRISRIVRPVQELSVRVTKPAVAWSHSVRPSYQATKQCSFRPAWRIGSNSPSQTRATGVGLRPSKQEDTLS